jgi:hypothetical protein
MSRDGSRSCWSAASGTLAAIWPRDTHALQGLVQVADEVNHKLQRLHTLLPWLRLIRQNLHLSINRVDDVVAVATVSRAVEALRIVEGDVYVVPWRRLAPLATNLVRPILRRRRFSRRQADPSLLFALEA